MSKKKIINKLREGTVSPDQLKKNTDDLVKTAKDALDIDDTQAKDYVSGFIGEAEDETGFNPVVQYHSDRTDETPFMINGTKWQYVNAIYPDGRKDIAVYRYGHDLAYDYKWFMDNVVGKLKNAADVTEVNQEVMDSMVKQYGPEKGKQIYYATANKQDRDPENFHTEGEHDSVGRGIEAGMNPEVEADKYEEYRALMQQLAAEEGGEEQPVKEEGRLTEGTSDYNLTNGDNISNMMRDVTSVIAKYLGTHSTNNGAVANDNRVILYDMIKSGDFVKHIQQMLPPSSMHYGSSGREYLTNNEKEMVRFLQSIGVNTEGITFRNMPVSEQVMKEEDGQGNDPVKLKADVEKLMAKLDISSITPYLAKIDNPVEQAEVIGQFAEKIGVPKAKLSSVIAQLKTVAESTKPKMTKNQLVEAVTGRKIVKTIKVKDIK